MWVCMQSMTAIGRRSDWQSAGIGRSAVAEVDASAADSAAILSFVLIILTYNL